MHSIKGKRAQQIDVAAIGDWAARYRDVILDLGTGDGRFVRRLARDCPAQAVIGVDTNQANLRVASRTAPANALFVVADALTLPGELLRSATRLTINFPWGSLLRGLLDGHAEWLATHASAGLTLDFWLNAGALAEAGWTLEAGGQRIVSQLRAAGFSVTPPRLLGPADLRAGPTTWAKRLAFGRDPRAVQIYARLP